MPEPPLGLDRPIDLALYVEQVRKQLSLPAAYMKMFASMRITSSARR
jgi:hypothetical protein